MRIKVADCYVNDNVFIVVDDVHALLDGRVEIDIPDSAAVHESVLFEVLRRENDWNRA